MTDEGAAEETFAPGDFILAVFPRMAGKLRPGVFVDRLQIGAADVIVATPATATKGAQPGALHVPEPPAAGLKPSRLLVPYTSALPADRVERLVIEERAVRLAPDLAEKLEAMVAHWFVRDWRARDPALRAPVKGPARLHCRSSQARRRTP